MSVTQASRHIAVSHCDFIYYEQQRAIRPLTGCNIVRYGSRQEINSSYAYRHLLAANVGSLGRDVHDRAGFKYAEALGSIIIRGPYPPSNAIIYMHLQL